MTIKPKTVGFAAPRNVKLTLTLLTGETVVTYWQTADDAKAWRKFTAASWDAAKLETV